MMGKVHITCICGKGLDVWHYDSKGDKNRRSCSDACRQRAYRQTEKGKASVERWNSQFKKGESKNE